MPQQKSHPFGRIIELDMPELFHRLQPVQQLAQGGNQLGKRGAQHPTMLDFHQIVRLATAKAERYALAPTTNRQSCHPPISLMLVIVQPVWLGQFIDAVAGKQLRHGTRLQSTLIRNRHMLQRAAATVCTVGTKRLFPFGRWRQHLEQVGGPVFVVLHQQAHPYPLALERAGHKQRLVLIPGQPHPMSIQLDNGHLQRRLCLSFGLVFLEELNHKTWSPRTGYVIISVC